METLSGTIQRLIFREADGYTVLELSVPGRLLPVTVVGRLAGVQPGEQLEVHGQWSQHARYGQQFRASDWSAVAPATHEGLLRYLGSGAVNGIGPALAARLVEHFGTELFDVAEQLPQRLTEVEGIGNKRAAALAAALSEQRAMRSVLVFLQGLGIGPAIAVRIYRHWGQQTAARLKADPYALVREVDGVGFVTADAIARRLGVEQQSPSRLAAGLLHLASSAADAGDTIRARQRLLAEAAAFLDADVDRLETQLDALIGDGLLQQRSVDAPDDDADHESVVGLTALVRAEERAAERLAALLQQPPRSVDDRRLLDAAELDLTDEQRSAVIMAASEPVTVITGGPGTGKTTVLRTLVRLIALREEPVHLCAPTGRAAKRLAEATGAPASTVHRLLGFGGGRFEHGHDNPLPWGTVILDEASMVDAPLMRYLLSSMTDDSALVLVGDQDQLPSVGPGNVLADLIASDTVPVARLTTVFRQAASSRIVSNAHRIRRGELPEPSSGGASGPGEFYIVRADDGPRAQQLVLQICCERIPQAFGLDPVADVQVLSPMHRGEAGTLALNQLLQQQLNPQGSALKRGRDELRVGDKVMQVRNDYDRDVFNGDIGRVAAIDSEEGSATVDMNGAAVKYGPEQLDQLSLAYCISIHKSQGSEYPAVVIPLLTQHYILLQRNLIYTAITRARRLVVLVGSPQAIRLAVQRKDPSRRRTLLCWSLRRIIEA